MERVSLNNIEWQQTYDPISRDILVHMHPYVCFFITGFSSFELSYIKHV